MVGGYGVMRVAVVHSYYSRRQPSGENVVVDLQVAALRRAGHEVTLLQRRTDDLEQSRTYPLAAAGRVLSGWGADPLEEIDASGADVVHVHNLFPNYGRTWARRCRVPVVATMHNYRPVCPAGTLFRDGASCTLCPDSGTARPAVTHACYRDSRLATLPVAIGTRFADDPLLSAARWVITLNDDMAATYAGVGVLPERLVTVPNFVADPGAGPGGEGWLFVGRLSTEKGILQLVRRWPAGVPLRVVGSGPLEAEVAAAAGPGVELLGQLPQEEVRRLLAGADGLVFPSLWPEGLPTVYLEALSVGTPVLASPESVVGGLVTTQGTGRVMSVDLAGDLAAAAGAFPRLRERCRDVYAAHYTEAAWVRSVEDLYARARIDG